MYGLPTSTEVKKQLPKKAIYAKFNMPTSQREHFDADIARLDIVGMVSICIQLVSIQNNSNIEKNDINFTISFH